MKKNSKNVLALIECFNNALNPFSDDIPTESLFNIASGKSLNDEAANFLLTIQEEGTKLRDALIDLRGFHEPIKRQSLKTFANAGAKVNTKKG